MIQRKVGRPCKYGYESIEPGKSLQLSFVTRAESERAQRAALSYARRAKRHFVTTRLDRTLTISRIE